MELNKEQIKKIDSFLEAIGIEYIDIRFEMVDHIASEIEDNVEDIDSFFKEDGFQTHFIKFMLSKKESLLQKYRAQEKNLNLFFIKSFCKSIVKTLLTPITLTTSLFLIFITTKLGHTYFKELSIVFITLTFLMHINTSIKINVFMKKYHEIKFISFYMILISMLSLLIMIFPGFIHVFVEGNYSTTALNKSLFTLLVTGIVHLNFYHKSKIVIERFKHLIQ